jgi:hypothetical protein
MPGVLSPPMYGSGHGKDVEISAEIRWFWRGTSPPGLKEWFTDASFHNCAAGGGNVRVDAYLSDPRQVELGIKLRGNRTGAEVKGLVAALAEGSQDSPFVGPIEIWVKWSSETLSLEGAELVLVSKRRWLRKFAFADLELQEIALDVNEFPINGQRLPDEGCNVEYTEISVEAALGWVTLAFEAYGTLDNVVACLRRTTARLSSRECPNLVGGWNASYPRWLRRIGSSEQP